MKAWSARVQWARSTSVNHDNAFDLLEALADYAAAGSVARDGAAGSLQLSISAPTIDEAIDLAITVVRDALAQHVTGAEVTGIDVMNQQAFDEELAQPLYPEVVGYAEIAQMAGVSRQRARQFSQIPSFPSPVIVTAQGPLMSKVAVDTWIKTRNTRPGRPRG